MHGEGGDEKKRQYKRSEKATRREIKKSRRKHCSNLELDL